MTRGTDQREKIYVRDTCETCKEDDVLIYENREGSILCAQCYRDYARRNPTPQHCDSCGTRTSVFRNGTNRDNVYMCLTCHQATGYKLDEAPHPEKKP
jgi:hypothetical protein